MDNTHIENRLSSERTRLLAFIRSKISSPEDAEDLLQDIYLQAMQHINVLRAVDNLSGWLFRVARNKIIDRYRRKKIPHVSLDREEENGRSLHELLHIPVDFQ